jgi:leucyl aminopeptidase
VDSMLAIQVIPRQEWDEGLIVVPRPAGSGEEDLLLVEKPGAVQELLLPIVLQVKDNAEALRRAGGKAARWLVQHKVQSVGLRVADLECVEVPEAVGAFCEGLLLGAFQFPHYKSGQGETLPTQVYLLADKDQKALKELVQIVSILAEGVNLARAIAVQPPNVINPLTLAEYALELAEQDGLTCRVLDEMELAEIGAGAMLAVGQGSQTHPRLILLEYPGGGGLAGSAPVVVVGKAMTFDSGGYMVKDRASIVGMKYDKCGGAAVLGLMHAISQLRLDTPVVGVIAAAENMISAAAFRPGDVIRSLAGKTIEITSTDAEGRLALCDALTYAQEHYQPRFLLDLATLTYGVVAALGKVRAGLMSNDDDMASLLLDCGERTGERLWRLPLDDDYLEYLHSDIADLKNYSGMKDASPVTGGVFLQQFVSAGVPWAHLDILGVATTEHDLPYCPRGATGFGVRLMMDYLLKLSEVFAFPRYIP